MNAMIINEYGENAKFESKEVEKPTLKNGQVLVKISASSVNTVDTMIKNMGKDLPFSPENPAILGMDFAGIIEQVGNDVTEFSVGDAVYGCAGGLADLQGTLADYITADTKLIARKPSNLTMKESASLPLVGITAYEGLTRANVQKGQKVLVHGGTGGVGHVAVQLAKHFGADVFTTISSEKQAEIVKSYGAKSINYKSESVEDYVNKHTDGKGFDIVYDSVGGENLLKSFEATALNGQVATTVSLSEIDLSTMHFKGLSLHVVFMLIPMIHNFQREKHGEILRDIAKIAESGALKPLLDEESFSLENVGKAYSRLESGNAIGKVVVEN
ncbi:zinc-dependent alcohol dehydrogenase family protein [Winogradskyella psychrotolerans]|uniref:zinc-dependent alcohol dehydrogenase family protein n=1 Tax=Winogradskyella psychrotolerans TaxID=1344585 RepID=UPI001C0713B2|nr:zinc-dependent alcohol dehydrogenase family protein [Winogradskyella psychrotolerans]MBU2921463.1 zinc-dependent alcohol dehydrogenase family protein [Winogradskyella psychrotolerans]